MKVILVIVAAILFSPLESRSQNRVDSLARARELRAQGRLAQAHGILKKWCKKHPNDAGAYWLWAQNDYWRKNHRKTRAHYRKAISLDPGNLYLKLDYMESLLGMGRYAYVLEQLQGFNKVEKKDAHYQLVLATAQFWSGDIQAAQQSALKAQKSGSLNAPALQEEILSARSFRLNLSGVYSEDSQPLTKIEPGLEAGLFSSKMADLHWLASASMLKRDSSPVYATRFEMGNRFHFPTTGTTLDISGGLFRIDNIKPVGSIELNQRLPGGWNVQASAARKPYLYTRASIDSSVFFTQGKLEIFWHEAHGLWIHAGVQADRFDDDNQTLGYGAWVLTPALKTWRLQTRVGYSYSRSDTRESRFFSVKTLEQLLNPWDSTARIEGRYTPYFTPENMESHALLAVVEFRISRHISLIFNGKYGIKASADNPYLFLDKDTDGQTGIYRGFQSTDFKPLEGGIKLAVQFSKSLSMEADYLYTRNFFYENRSAGLRIKMII